MPGPEPVPISVGDAFEELGFMADRTPETPDDHSSDAFGRLADYRDGAIFVAHYAGASPWERHGAGDEIVAVVEGATSIFMLLDGEERCWPLTAGTFIVVPQGVWHRFESPEPVKVISVTPQPTDHSIERPG